MGKARTPWRQAGGALWPPLLALVVVLAGWEASTRLLAIPAFLLPPPSRIARALLRDRESLLPAMLTTCRAAMFGYGLTIVLGVLLGALLSTSRALELALYPYALFLQTVPIVAVAPLLVLWFGPGSRAVTAAALIVSIFPMIAGTLSGMRLSNRDLHDMFRLYGASRVQLLLKLRLPTAVPQIVNGMKVSAGLSVIGAIVGEFVAGFSEGGAGLGITILASYRQLRTDLMFAAVLLSALLGLFLLLLAQTLGGAFLRRWGLRT